MQYDLLSRLKAETAQCHSRLENALDLMRAEWPRDEYISLLEAFYGYITPWEEAASAAMPDHFKAFFDERRKSSMLAADIVVMTRDRGRIRTLPLAGEDDLPDMHGLGRVFGSMYVMEGSTLGGRFIAPHVATLFGLQKGEGNAYFEAYGPRTGSMWNAFRETAASAVPATGDEYDAAVSAAVQTFDGLHAWLSEARSARVETGTPA